jgi:hypothetical protein
VLCVSFHGPTKSLGGQENVVRTRPSPVALEFSPPPGAVLTRRRVPPAPGQRHKRAETGGAGNLAARATEYPVPFFISRAARAIREAGSVPSRAEHTERRRWQPSPRRSAPRCTPRRRRVRNQRRAPSTVRCDSTPPPSAASFDPDFDKKAFRHNLTRSENYNRKGFGHKKETLELMSQEYTSK